MAWPSIDPGELRHQLTFLDQQIGFDKSGTNITWVASSPPRTIRAKIEEATADDKYKSGIDISHVALKVTIRWEASILQNARFTTEQGALFIIKGIENVEHRNVKLIMICEGIGPNA